MTSGQIIDTAVGVYRAYGWTLLKLTVLPSILCLASVAFLYQFAFPALVSTNHPNSIAAQATEAVGVIGLSVLVSGFLFATGVAQISSIVSRIVSDYMIGKTPDAVAAIADSRRIVLRVTGLCLTEVVASLWVFLVSMGLSFLATYMGDTLQGVFALIGVLGMIGGGLAAILVVSYHALSVPVMVIEGTGIRASIRRSKELLKSTPLAPAGTGPVHSVFALMAFLGLVIYFGIALSFSLVGAQGMVESLTNGFEIQRILLPLLDLLPSFLMLWTIIPIWAAAITVIYYDRRIRREGYDIEALAEEITRSGRPNRFDL